MKTTIELVLELIKDPRNKTILEVGGHDDSLTLDLAKHFKHVYSYYEFLKIPEREENNFTIKKKSFLSVLDSVNKYDVILLENEFHHIPDIWQMWTYDKLKNNQELLLQEWNFTGTVNYYYRSFQNCKPLCGLTRSILRNFVRNKIISIEKIEKGGYEDIVNNKEEMIAFYKFILPDHWRYGEKEFMKKIEKITYPYKLWEGFDLIKIGKTV